MQKEEYFLSRNITILNIQNKIEIQKQSLIRAENFRMADFGINA